MLYHASVTQAAALSEFERVLQPGGLLVLNVPAFEALRGSHDVAVCGARRYIACHVHEWLRRHNLEAEMIHYWNAWLFLPLCIWRRFSRTSSCRSLGFEGSDLTPLPSLFNTIAGLVSRWDACFCRWTRLPFGTSIFALATKPHHGRSNED